MEKETKRKIKSFTIDVIDFFLGVPESFIYAFDRKEFYRLLNGRPTEKVFTCNNIAKLISNLKRSGYIEVKKSGDNESIIFTNKARLAIVDRIAGRSGSDGKHRFVSFDIPERLRQNRDQFRRAIKRLGFRQIQKSLWVCDKNIGDLVESATEEYKVTEYVVYIVSENTNIETTISNMFAKK